MGKNLERSKDMAEFIGWINISLEPCWYDFDSGLMNPCPEGDEEAWCGVPPDDIESYLKVDSDTQYRYLSPIPSEEEMKGSALEKLANNNVVILKTKEGLFRCFKHRDEDLYKFSIDSKTYMDAINTAIQDILPKSSIKPPCFSQADQQRC